MPFGWCRSGLCTSTCCTASLNGQVCMFVCVSVPTISLPGLTPSGCRGGFARALVNSHTQPSAYPSISMAAVQHLGQHASHSNTVPEFPCCNTVDSDSDKPCVVREHADINVFVSLCPVLRLALSGKTIHKQHHEQPYHHVSLDPPALVLGVMLLASAVFAALLGPGSPLWLTATATYWAAGTLVCMCVHVCVHGLGTHSCMQQCCC